MDENPSRLFSPQTVGNEFVRQYYTLLNKAPNHLHRFYNNYSSFTHGDSQLLVGQREIHKRIQELDFKDCQANITRVDAQASPGDGVVVQVIGELSNDGHPMRRFCQTFVLAALGSKKYYVHNDIFSYQDLGHAEEQDQNREQLDNSEIQMGNQAVPVTCKLVHLNRDISMEDELDQNAEQAEEPGIQIVSEAVSIKDLYTEDKQNQNEKHQIQMVDEAVQVACDMVSKYTQPEQVASRKTSCAASQTVEFSLPAKHNSPQPESIPNKVTPRRTCPVEQQKPKGTKAGFEVSPQCIQQQRQEQLPLTVMQKEQKESLPQKQLLFSESIGGQMDAAQTNANKSSGKRLISIELDISIYLVDKP